MDGTYDLSMVGVSYVVAILASYCALHFATQLSAISGSKRYLWLSLGAMSMGLGIWSMHFIGMGAYKMHMPMSYDLTMTLVSCIAAVLSSGLALYLISRMDLGWVMLAPGSIVMGAGIAIMHYLGMAAMKMTPEVSYEPVWFSISIVIAIVASAAAMAICRYTQTLVGTRAAVFQGIAALVMGAAICGMHYSGMAAVIFPPGSVPDPANQLGENELGVPVVLAAVVFVLVALITVYTDIRARIAQQENDRLEKKRAEEWAEDKAFSDGISGLPNRAGLEQYLAQTIAANQATRKQFAVLILEMTNLRELEASMSAADMKQNLRLLSEQIKLSLTERSYLARYSGNRFCIVTQEPLALDARQHITELFSGSGLPMANGLDIRWSAGFSFYPLGAGSNRELLRQALKTQPLLTVAPNGNVSVA